MEQAPFKERLDPPSIFPVFCIVGCNEQGAALPWEEQAAHYASVEVGVGGWVLPDIARQTMVR